MNILKPVLILTTTSTALMAGLFYAYSCSVVPGLRLLDDRGYLSAMQSINKAIQNPVFFAPFFGTLVLLPLSTYLGYDKNSGTGFWLIVAASAFYYIGVFGVTVFGNVPLNDGLEKFDLAKASAAAINEQRKAFERPWNGLNMIRTVSSIAALVLMVVACLRVVKGSSALAPH